jgi:general stress protein 26
MTDRSLEDIAEKMRGIDIAMLNTHTEGGGISGRPMSNNGDVDYDGESFYFTNEETRLVEEIEDDPAVSLDFTGKKDFYLAVSGTAELIRDKDAFEAHWTPDLDKWFENGVDTPGLVMIKVHAERISYWDGKDQGEVSA